MPYTLDPQTGQKVPVGGTKPTSSSSGSTGNNLSNVRQLFALMILSKAKKPSDIATAFQLMQQTPQELKIADAKKEKDQKLQELDDAIKLLEKGKVKTGVIAGPLLKLKVDVLGSANSDQIQAYQTIQKIGAQKMFEIGGKVLPAQEISRLIPFTPDVSKATQSNLANLKRLRNELGTAYDRSISGDTSTGGMSNTTSSQNEDEWEAY